MNAVAWRIQTSNKNEFNYRLQVENISGVRAKNRILKAVDNWKHVGEGRNKRKDLIMLFSRTFNDRQSWVKWARQFPYDLAELKKNGTLKPIKRRKA